jgi:hypothetical protein
MLISDVRSYRLLLIDFVADTAHNHDAESAIARKDKRPLPLPVRVFSSLSLFYFYFLLIFCYYFISLFSSIFPLGFFLSIF